MSNIHGSTGGAIQYLSPVLDFGNVLKVQGSSLSVVAFVVLVGTHLCSHSVWRSEAVWRAIKSAWSPSPPETDAA